MTEFMNKHNKLMFYFSLILLFSTLAFLGWYGSQGTHEAVITITIIFASGVLMISKSHGALKRYGESLEADVAELVIALCGFKIIMFAHLVSFSIIAGFTMMCVSSVIFIRILKLFIKWPNVLMK